MTEMIRDSDGEVVAAKDVVVPAKVLTPVDRTRPWGFLLVAVFLVTYGLVMFGAAGSRSTHRVDTADVPAPPAAQQVR